jgi:hypothetical protein
MLLPWDGKAVVLVFVGFFIWFVISLFTVGCYNPPCDHSNCEYTQSLQEIDSLCNRFKAEISKQIANNDTTGVITMVDFLEGLRECQKRLRLECSGVDSTFLKRKFN